MDHLGDETLLQLLQGEPAPGEVRDHFDSCSNCRRLFASLAKTSMTLQAPAPPGMPLPRGAVIDRYVILHGIGAGGMGVVYAAYDPELDRQVALKLLRSAEGSESELRTRLLREAQAMARLQHPNVIAVHDSGTFEGRVYLAMELVDGWTLGAWLRERGRSRREIIPTFIAAGRGLQAAHDAGLVHRDFKPENVLVGRDGRVRVTDFGLARSSEEAAAPPVAVDNAVDHLSQTLTNTGALMGTPAYMSPEQLAGERPTERSDQFAFCVALWEALHGARPFAGDDLKTLRLNVLEGRVSTPAGARVPGRLRRALLRGLSRDPAARFPSMAALLEALPESRPGLGVWLSGALVVLLAATAGGVAWRQRSRMCTGAESKLAGAWDAPVRAGVERAFAKIKRPFVADSLRATTTALDDYARKWAAQHSDACQATHLRGEQSEALLDLRMRCLDDRRRELASLAASFAEADEALVSRAADAAHKLTGLEHCADVRTLSAVPPPTTAIRPAVDTERTRIAEARGQFEAGRYDPALKAARAAVAEAQRLAYRPLAADAWFLAAEILQKKGEVKEAEKSFYQALYAAEEAHDDRLAARAWIGLLHVGVYLQARYAEADHLGQQVQALINRLGGDDALQGQLEYYRGAIAMELGHAAEAETQMQKALKLFEKSIGAEHAYYAATLDALSVVQLNQNRFDDALATVKRALELTERVQGPEHPDAAYAWDKLGAIYMAQHKLPEARRAKERSLALRQHSNDDPYLGVSLVNLADLNRLENQLAPALALHKQAQPVFERTLGPEHPYVAETLQGQAWLLVELGRSKEALELARRCVAIDEKIDPKGLHLMTALTRVGEAQLGLGAPAQALPPLERAIALLEARSDSQASDGAETRFALARALWGARRDRAGALRQADKARAAFTAAGPNGANDVRRIDAWQKSAGLKGREE